MAISYCSTKRRRALASLVASIPFSDESVSNEFVSDESVGSRTTLKAGGLALLACLSLAGCTGMTYSGHFDCPLSPGVNCASLSQVNKMVDRQEIDLGDTGDEAENFVTGSPGKVLPPSHQLYVYYGPGQGVRLVSVPGEPGTDASKTDSSVGSRQEEKGM